MEFKDSHFGTLEKEHFESVIEKTESKDIEPFVTKVLPSTVEDSFVFVSNENHDISVSSQVAIEISPKNEENKNNPIEEEKESTHNQEFVTNRMNVCKFYLFKN